MTNNRSTKRRPINAAIPAVGILGGIAYLVAGLIGGDIAFAVGGLVLMLLVTGLFVLARGRSEIVQGLLDRSDERINQIDLLASTAAGMSVLGACIIWFIVDIARGGDGEPFYWLAALGGVVYIIAVVVLRFRK